MIHSTLKETVVWFLHNLKLQIEDISLEKKGVGLDIYFDTADVRGALLGMEAFFTPGRGFNIATFFEERTLVQSLGAGGWLGPIQLLPPHQAEFFNLLNLDFGVAIPKDPEPHAQEFLYQIKTAGAIDTGLSGSPETRENIVEFIREHASSAINLFKAVQCIRGVNWQKRLVGWRQTGRLKLKPIDENYATLLRLPLFYELKAAFDNRRPNSSVNNFADAVAIILLTLLVGRFNKGETESIPRFFASTNLFREAISDAGIGSLLQYKSGPKTTSSVLRGEDYFKFMAIFRSSPKNLSGERIVDLDAELDSLDELRKQIEAILSAQEPLTPEAVDRIVFAGRPLGEIIQELQELSFFENVWLPFAGKREAQDALRELGEAVQQLKSDSFENAVGKAIEETKQELDENVKGYRLVSSLWTHLEEASLNLHASLRKDPGKSLDVFWDLGLLRFDFPKNTHQRIAAVLEALFGKDEEAERDARVSVISAYYSYARHEDATRKEGELALASAVLWVAKMDKELIRLLDKLVRHVHYSLQIVYTAALFRVNNKIRLGQNVMGMLKRRYELEDEPARRAGLAVGLAYLNFHLWDRLGFTPAWLSSASRKPNAPFELGQKLIGDAIHFAKEAYNDVENLDIQKHVYATNQYLYYLVEGGDDSHMESSKLLAQQLANSRENPSLWQYRFDDTLARYFHRLAISTDAAETKMELMTIAKRYLETACLGPYKDEQVERYRALFDVDYANLITSHIKPPEK